MERFLTKIIRLLIAIALFFIAVVLFNLLFIPAHFISLFVKNKDYWRVSYLTLYKSAYRSSKEVYINGFPI